MIARKGAETASVEDFVAAAGVSRGTFYNYFPTVPDLVEALNARLAKAMAERLRTVDFDRPDLVERMAARMLHTLAAACEDPIRGWVILRLMQAALPRQDRLEVLFKDSFAECVAQGRLRPMDSTVAASFAFGALRMAQRDVVEGVVARHQLPDIVEAVLVGLGLPCEEARRIMAAEAARAGLRPAA